MLLLTHTRMSHYGYSKVHLNRRGDQLDRLEYTMEYTGVWSSAGFWFCKNHLSLRRMRVVRVTNSTVTYMEIRSEMPRLLYAMSDEARWHESYVHLRYIWLKKIGRTRASAARGCANAAPAAMPLPTEAREGCSGLVGDACARQLDGGVDGRRPPHCRR